MFIYTCSRLNKRFISTSLVVPAGEDYTTRVLFRDGPMEVYASCDFETGSTSKGSRVYVRTYQTNEEMMLYGQSSVAGAVNGSIPAGTGEGPTHTIFATHYDPSYDDNNDKNSGAFTIVGQTTGRRWYSGIAGSSFLGTYDEEHKTCDFTGVISSGFSGSGIMGSSKANKLD